MLAEQYEEWAEQRRYRSLDAQSKAGLAIVPNPTTDDIERSQEPQAISA